MDGIMHASWKSFHAATPLRRGRFSTYSEVLAVKERGVSQGEDHIIARRRQRLSVMF
jgi:hypothetical protein